MQKGLSFIFQTFMTNRMELNMSRLNEYFSGKGFVKVDAETGENRSIVSYDTFPLPAIALIQPQFCYSLRTLDPVNPVESVDPLNGKTARERERGGERKKERSRKKGCVCFFVFPSCLLLSVCCCAELSDLHYPQLVPFSLVTCLLAQEELT